MSNGYGGFRVQRDREMAAYDTAPPRLRWMIRNAVAPWAVEDMVQNFHRLRRMVSEPEALDIITEAMLQGEARGTLEAYGPTHPEARVDH